MNQVTKREAKKAVQEAKFQTYDELYGKLGTQNGENNIQKHAETNN